MILVVTKTEDKTADYVLDKMEKRKIPFFRLNTDVFGRNTQIIFDFTADNGFIISDDGRKINASDIKSVWFRRKSKPEMPMIKNNEAREFAEQELNFTLSWFIDSLKVPIIDRETDILHARNKFDQLMTARKLGLITPQTLITNDPGEAGRFIKSHPNALIKSIGGFGVRRDGGFEAVYAQQVNENIIKKIESVRLAPICLQEYVEKKFELRITIVNQRIFSCKIDSQTEDRAKIDWRRGTAKLNHSVFLLDKKIEKLLLRLMENYKIHFASFDLIFTPDGKIVFLEMNPGSQFVWVEELTGMPITDALIDELLN